MSSSEERIMILKMLEEGKITSEQAAKLLESLDGAQSRAQGQDYGPRRTAQQANFYEEIEKARQRLNEWKNDFNKKYSQKDFDRMIDEFSVKAEKIGKQVANTTFGFVDKMVDFVGSFVDTNAFNVFGSYKLEEKSFEADAAEGLNLRVEGLNGNILVKRHVDNRIIIKSKVRSPLNNADELLNFNKDENWISLGLSKPGNFSVSHEIYLPAVKLGEVRLTTANGKIYVEDCLSALFEAVTKNAPIDLMGVNSDKVSLRTRNAKIQIGYIIAKDIEIDTNNSLIDAKNLKTAGIKAVTTNGRIFVENIQNLSDAPEVNVLLKTTNGGIKVNMNDMDNRGYKVNARTTHGNINLLIPELIFHNANKQTAGASFMEAESNGYNNYPARVNIYSETVNGDVEIVK